MPLTYFCVPLRSIDLRKVCRLHIHMSSRVAAAVNLDPSPQDRALDPLRCPYPSAWLSNPLDGLLHEAASCVRPEAQTG